MCRNKRKNKNKSLPWWKEKERQLAQFFKVGPKNVLVRFSGIWYSYDLEEPRMVRSTKWNCLTQQYEECEVLVNPDQLSKHFAIHNSAIYDSRFDPRKYYKGNARNKRQLNSQELKKLGLQNDKIAI